MAYTTIQQIYELYMYNTIFCVRLVEEEKVVVVEYERREEETHKKGKKEENECKTIKRQNDVASASYDVETTSFQSLQKKILTNELQIRLRFEIYHRPCSYRNEMQETS